MNKVIVPVVFLVCAAVVLIVMLVETAPAQPAVAGNVQVIGGTPPVMLEPGSGKTWVLVTSTNPRRMVWVPVKRLDSDADIEKWTITGKAREELEK